MIIPEEVHIDNQAGMEMIENYKDKLIEMGFDIIRIESDNKRNYSYDIRRKDKYQRNDH